MKSFKMYLISMQFRQQQKWSYHLAVFCIVLYIKNLYTEDKLNHLNGILNGIDDMNKDDFYTISSKFSRGMTRNSERNQAGLT